MLYLEFLHGNVGTILAWLRDNRKGGKHTAVINKHWFWKSGESLLVLNFILAFENYLYRHLDSSDLQRMPDCTKKWQLKPKTKKIEG